MSAVIVNNEEQNETLGERVFTVLLLALFALVSLILAVVLFSLLSGGAVQVGGLRTGVRPAGHSSSAVQA